MDDREQKRREAHEARRAAAEKAHQLAIEKYGDEEDDGCRLVEVVKHFFVFRRLTRGEYDRVKDAGAKRDEQELYAVLRDCVVHPERAEFLRLADRYPALQDELSSVLLDLAGATGEALAKKR